MPDDVAREPRAPSHHAETAWPVRGSQAGRDRFDSEGGSAADIAEDCDRVNRERADLAKQLRVPQPKPLGRRSARDDSDGVPPAAG